MPTSTARSGCPPPTWTTYATQASSEAASCLAWAQHHGYHPTNVVAALNLSPRPALSLNRLAQHRHRRPFTQRRDDPSRCRRRDAHVRTLSVRRDDDEGRNG